MSAFSKYLLNVLLCAAVMLLQPAPLKAQQLFVKINPVFNEKPLVLNDQHYITANGDTVSIETLKFYLSNFALISNGRPVKEKNSYHLADADDSASLFFSVNNIPAGAYQQLQFDIGVDSLANVSGAMSGALDPLNGMYWTWNTGYINAKLAGRSSACKTFHHQFNFHIGGYTKPYTTLREVRLPLNNIVVPVTGVSIIELNMDISQWFKSPKLINLADNNNVVMPGKAAAQIADNYMDMFSIKIQP